MRENAEEGGRTKHQKLPVQPALLIQIVKRVNHSPMMTLREFPDEAISDPTLDGEVV